MKSKLRIYAAVSLVLAGLLLVAPASPGSSMAAPTASLAISPKSYVGGQSITFTGNLGVSGERNVHLQFNMGASRSWTDLPGSTARTRPDGSFSFSNPALSMFGIRIRVASGRLATPAVTSSARSQDLVLDVDSGDPTLPPGQVRAGQPFSIRVDTTPTLPHRPDLPPPAFPGRTLTLQQRIDPDQWKTLDTTQTNQAGEGQFQSTAGASDMVLRVRQEDWTTNGSEVGWYPSFPTYVDVVGPTAAAPAVGTTAVTRQTTSSPAGPAGTARTGVVASRASGSTSASQKYGWRPALWDFAWELGESLTSRPYRGTDRKGWWLDSSSGSGRAAKHNGGLMLDSQRGVDGPGDFGTTAATLHGNPMTYGRWETKLRLKSPETNARDYHVRLELVPAQTADYHCGGQNITVADLTPHGSAVTVGARAFRLAKQWTSRSPLGSLIGPSATFSVELARGHISWFVNGRVVATLRDQAAVSDVPMTMRLSLVGEGQREMNRTQVISDWQRGYSIDRGQTVTSGQAPRRGSYAGGC